MRNCDLRTTPTEKTSICLLVFLLAISACGKNTRQPNWKPAEIIHNVADTNSLKMIWGRSNIYVGDLAVLGLAASNDKVFIAGGTDINESSSLIALDIFTGETAWKTEPEILFLVYTNDNELYTGGSGKGGRVTRYDPASGKVVWSRDFWDSGGVLHLIIYENNLHIYLSPDKHKVLRISDGETIFTLFPASPPFFDLGICGIAYQTPIYTSDTIYFRSNVSEFKGEICAVNISTGQLRWKTDLNVISNVVVNQNAVFVLVEGGELLALDPSTGAKVDSLSISFDNGPFMLYSTRTASGSFFLTYDEKNNILLAYLGDSRQLFAFLVGAKQ